MANLSHVPHTRDVKAGVNKYDPVHGSIFEVFFTFPIITGVKGDDIALLPEQVTNVSGLGALHKTPTITTKKFYGIDVSFLDRNLDSSFIDFTIKFNLNLREATDNYVLTAFMKWRDVNYSLATGAQYLRPDYLAEKIVIHIANRAGIIWRTVVFYDCILSTISGLEDLDITSNDALSLSCTFRSDYWDDYVYSPKKEYTPVKHDHSISSYVTGINETTDNDITNNSTTNNNLPSNGASGNNNQFKPGVRPELPGGHQGHQQLPVRPAYR